MFTKRIPVPTQKQLTFWYWLPLRIAAYLHTLYLSIIFIMLVVRPGNATYATLYDRWFSPMYRYYLLFWGVQFIYFIIIRAGTLYYQQKTRYPVDIFCLSLIYYTVLIIETILLLMVKLSLLK